MCNYCGTNKYRKIYECHFGPIQKDEYGRSYDIHHIDGNRDNNDLSNLKAVSIHEHFDIHLSQGDFMACHRILARMNTSPELLSMLSKIATRKRVEDGTHNFLGGEIQRRTNHKRLKEGTHPFLDGEATRARQLAKVQNGTHHFVGPTNPVYKQLADGTHPWHGGEVSRRNMRRLVDEGKHIFLGGAIHRRRVAEGTHPFLGGEIQRKYARQRVAEGTHQNFRPLCCPHCGKQGKGSIMLRWHFDNCKHRPL